MFFGQTSYAQVSTFEWLQHALRNNRTTYQFSVTDANTDGIGNFYVLGRLESSASFGGTLLEGSSLGSAFFVAKYDRAGTLKWEVAGRPGIPIYPSSVIAPNRLAVDTEGNFLVIGNDLEASVGMGGKTFPFVIKYDRSGTRQWIYQEAVSSAAADDSGYFYFIRYSSSQAILAKLDTVGARTDVMVVSTNSTTFNVRDIALDRLGNIFIAGGFSATLDLSGTHLVSRGLTDVFVAKLNSTGNLLWIQQGGGSGSDLAERMAIDGAGQVCISGIFGDGFTNSSATFGDVTLSVHDTNNTFVVKYGANGNLLWARQISGMSASPIVNISANDRGDVFLASSFANRAELDSVTLTSRGGSDGLVAAYDAEGNLRWVQQLGGTLDDFVNGLASDPAAQFFFCKFVEQETEG